MSTVKSKKLQVGTDASASNNFTIYQPSTPDGTLRIGVGNADSPTEVAQFNSNGYVATKAPAFSAYMSAAQSISNTTWTKLQYDAEEFDLTSDYDTSAIRFIPSVEGYYQINASVYLGNQNNARVMRLYKNGSPVKRGGTRVAVSGSGSSSEISTLVYANGTTDYFEIYLYQTSGITITNNAGSELTFFQAFLARAV